MTEWIFSSSALILIIIALRGLLKAKLRPMVRYCLWGLVLVRLLLPFSLFESTLSLGNALRELNQRTDSAVTQYETTYDQVVQQHIHTGTSATPAQLREEVRQQVYDHTYSSIADRYAQQGITVPEQQLQQEAQVQTQTIDLLVLATDLLPAIWYVGMALMTLAFLVSNGWFARKLHRTRTPMAVSDYPLPVFVTAYPATPCLFGLIRPKIYLTPESVQDETLLRHVLAHELTHFRHGDHIWSALRGICLVLHWYNPLVWAAVLLSKKDAELACDEATIRTLGEDERIAYGRTLIGMTCVKRDPKSFLITATTMISGKHTLRERITAIARKPKNAILAVIACVLVLSIAAGCTFSGAPANPTEPTTALDAVYEKVQAAAQAINTQEALHVKYYISPEMPLNETDLASRTTYNEVWISGEDLYEARHEQNLIIPQILHYHGSIYNHIRDNLWLPAVSSTRTPDDYRLHIPRRSECTMSWIEANGYLDVTFANNSGNNGSGTEIRLDADGNLIWYASYIHTTESTDDPGEGAVMYVIMTYEDTNSQQIKAHLDTVAPQLIAGMETGNDTPPTPTGVVSGGLSRATVQVGERLYIFLGGMNLGSVPSGYELAGTVSHSDPNNLPLEDLQGTLSVGTEIYVNPFNPRYIYYRTVTGAEVDVRQMERIDYAGYSIYDLTCDEGYSRLPVIYPDTPAVPPEHREVFLYSDSPNWYLYDDLEGQDCQDGYLYTWYPQGDRLATKVSEEPVVCYTAIYNSVFYFTESGKLIQSDIDGYPCQIIYTASGKPGNLAYYYPNLYFTDGDDLIVLDITAGRSYVVGCFEDCQYINPVTDTWLWLVIQGNSIAYDTATGNIAPILAEGHLHDFSEGEWPDTTVDLPENYELSDIVSARKEALSWVCERGHQHTLSISLPDICPYSNMAIRLQERINEDWLPLIQEQRTSRDTRTCPYLLSVDFEAGLNPYVLSVVIHGRLDSDYHSYGVYNVSTIAGEYLSTSQMARRFLSVSYPQFLMAVSEYRLEQFRTAHPGTDMEEFIHAYGADVMNLDQTALYLDENGTLCLRYDSLDPGGVVFYPTVTPFPEDLEFSGTDAAYAWLFGMYESRVWDDENRLYNYWSILHKVYGADIDEFENQSDMLDPALRQSIWSFMFSDGPTQK